MLFNNILHDMKFLMVLERLVSKRVVLADVPLYRHFLQESYPCSATWQKEAMIFDIPRPQKPERGHIRQTRPFTKLHFVSSRHLLDYLNCGMQRCYGAKRAN